MQVGTILHTSVGLRLFENWSMEHLLGGNSFYFQIPTAPRCSGLLKCARLGSVRYVSVKETIDCEKTDAGARREVPMNAIYVN